MLSSDGVKIFLKKRKVKDLVLVASSSMKQDFIDAGFEVDSLVSEYVVLGYDI